MKLAEVDQNTEDTFFRCLHDEKPADPRVIELRRRLYDRYKEKGLRAKVLVRDDQEIVGLCQYLPIEHSHVIGEDLFVILCIWVHGYEHLVGNQQGKGLDVGCGYGAIGLPLAKQAAHGIVHLIDKDFVAVEYAKRNAVENGIHNVAVIGNIYELVRETDQIWVDLRTFWVRECPS